MDSFHSAAFAASALVAALGSAGLASAHTVAAHSSDLNIAFVVVEFALAFVTNF